MAKVGNIPSSWLNITNAWSAEVNLNLLQEVDHRGIAHDDLGAVRAIWNEIQENAANALKAEQEASTRRQEEAKASTNKIKNIKSQFPALQWKK